MSSAAPDHLSMLRACAVAGDTEGFARSLGSLDTALCDSNEFLRELTALFHTAKSSSSVFSEKPEQLASALLTYFRGDSFCNSVVATVFRIDVYSQHGILLRDVEVGAKDMRDFSVLLLMEADLVGCYLDMKKVMTVEKIQMLTSLWHYFTFAVPRKVLTSLGKYRHNLKESNVYNVALWKTLMGALRAYENHAFEFSFVKMVSNGIAAPPRVVNTRC